MRSFKPCGIACEAGPRQRTLPHGALVSVGFADERFARGCFALLSMTEEGKREWAMDAW